MPTRAQRYSLVFLVAALSSAAAIADIYGYVDAEGVQHYSNFPDSAQYRLVLSDPDPATPCRDKCRKTGSRKQAIHTQSFLSSIRREAAANRLDPLLIEAVIAVESGHNPNARSPVGAAGLMQLMPTTARRYGVDDPYHADSNIRGGSRYLRDLLSMFDGNLHLALAAYNAGENAVIRYGRKIPPYAETQNYVPRVLQKYAALKNP